MSAGEYDLDLSGGVMEVFNVLFAFLSNLYLFWESKLVSKTHSKMATASLIVDSFPY